MKYIPEKKVDYYYTNGDEFRTLDNNNYIGLYYESSEMKYTKDTKEILLPIDLSENIVEYLKLTSFDLYGDIESITPYKPTVTDDDYFNRYITRYFAKKRTSDLIFEIDKENFLILKQNYNTYYKVTSLLWGVSKTSNHSIENDNLETVINKDKEMLGLKNILTDYTEFSL